MTEKLQQDAGDAAFALALSALTNLESRNTKKAREDISRLLVTLRIPIGADDPLIIFSSNFATVCNRLGICEYFPMILASLDDGRSDLAAVMEMLQHIVDKVNHIVDKVDHVGDEVNHVGDEIKALASKGSNASKTFDQHLAETVDRMLMQKGYLKLRPELTRKMVNDYVSGKKRDMPTVYYEAETIAKKRMADMGAPEADF